MFLLRPMEGLLPNVVGGCFVALGVMTVLSMAADDALMLEPGIW